MPKREECAYLYQFDVAVVAYEKIAQVCCVPVAKMDEDTARKNLAFIAGIVGCAEAIMDKIHERSHEEIEGLKKMMGAGMDGECRSECRSE